MRLDELNDRLRADCPALFAALSPLGRRAAFPPDIPFQAAEARGKRFDATIGQITDGAGGALALPPVAEALADLETGERNQALLYSPVEGIAALRDAWRSWQRRAVEASMPSSRPLVTVGLTHGLSLAADLFGEEGRPVAVPAPYWGNYRQVFELRTGCRMVSAPAYRDGRFHCEAVAEALAEVEQRIPAVAILNLPSNPGGYSATVDERRRIVASLCGEAERRPLVVLVDDAYAGLVYRPEVPARSLFWDLVGAHERLVPIKVDGGTKEFSLFGGRVGFLTFAVDPGSGAAEALESKVKCLVRATVGSPVATSQVLLLRALTDGHAADHVETVRRTLERRWEILTGALEGVDRRHLEPMPCNSGCFSLVRLPGGLDPNAVRRTLLDGYETGLVSVAPDFLRIAFCSVREGDLPELVERLGAGVAALAR